MRYNKFIKFDHNVQNFQFFMKSLIRTYRLFGYSAALEYINNLTKGLPATKFITKGKYWHGSANNEYEKRVRESKENSFNPSRVDLALTGVKGPS